MTAQITSSDAIAAFVMAGNATFTLVSKRTQARFTYRVRASEDGRVHFVSVLTGTNNETDYAYAGIIRDGFFNHTAKSRVTADAPSAKAFTWFYHHMVRAGVPTDQIEFWHEGCCGRCGRTLTVPSSIASGFGPECTRLMCEAA